MYQSAHPEDRKFLRARFKQLEGEYRYKLNAAKRDGWTGTGEEVTVEQPFGVHFDVAKAPDRRNFQLTTVRKADGSLTATTEEALQEHLNYNFPIDSYTHSPSHAQIRNTCRIPPSSNDDPMLTVQEVEAAVKNIRSKKAPGPDGLFGDIIKEAYAAKKVFLTDIFNKWLLQGYFPNRWKEANLVLFNKTNRDDTSPAAFRPICLLDALGKFLNRLLTQRIFHHLLKTGRINQKQFGFTPGRSATEAIVQLNNWICTARDEGNHSVIICLDVQSSFSRVWWPLVLHNLKVMYCPKKLFGLTASFLDNRSISLQYGENSISKSYTIGCPQGSNSGPLLWLLVINDALEVDFPTDVRLLAYAENMYLFIAATGKQTIKSRDTEALEILNNWSKKARVQFAHEKTQLFPFGKKGRQKHPPYCSFAGKSIKLARQMKILGVVLDDGLNGKAHLNSIGDKIPKILNRLTIAKSNRGLSGRVLKALYKRALERILVYAALAWWTGTVKQVDKINSIQRQVLLAITGAFRTTSTAALQVISGVEPADLVCELEFAVYKLKHASSNVQYLGVDLQGLSMEKYIPPGFTQAQ
ncbi:Retrovirus-related Pol polyprotein from type-1 retrotransposable element R1 [Araneus ventricosus]|uniref:Retrovirus-related Pol polyprotein from type-1 retrotransposable element R1 n=1 Tax=Araneus ventricosus TaxID=182803 RepID=A0A4Y2Q0Y7_ARAVE|nr:Retrovirus-related Pol polyprotein from type-1 retrotransposable element R1 [Araneus ventricosus]